MAATVKALGRDTSPHLPFAERRRLGLPPNAQAPSHTRGHDLALCRVVNADPAWQLLFVFYHLKAHFGRDLRVKDDLCRVIAEFFDLFHHLDGLAIYGDAEL